VGERWSDDELRMVTAIGDTFGRVVDETRLDDPERGDSYGPCHRCGSLTVIRDPSGHWRCPWECPRLLHHDPEAYWCGNCGVLHEHRPDPSECEVEASRRDRRETDDGSPEGGEMISTVRAVVRRHCEHLPVRIRLIGSAAYSADPGDLDLLIEPHPWVFPLRPTGVDDWHGALHMVPPTELSDLCAALAAVSAETGLALDVHCHPFGDGCVDAQYSVAEGWTFIWNPEYFYDDAEVLTDGRPGRP
jgi:hypothetical protein